MKWKTSEDRIGVWPRLWLAIEEALSKEVSFLVFYFTPFKGDIYVLKSNQLH